MSEEEPYCAATRFVEQCVFGEVEGDEDGERVLWQLVTEDPAPAPTPQGVDEVMRRMLQLWPDVPASEIIVQGSEEDCDRVVSNSALCRQMCRVMHRWLSLHLESVLESVFGERLVTVLPQPMVGCEALRPAVCGRRFSHLSNAYQSHSGAPVGGFVHAKLARGPVAGYDWSFSQ